MVSTCILLGLIHLLAVCVHDSHSFSAQYKPLHSRRWLHPLRASVESSAGQDDAQAVVSRPKALSAAAGFMFLIESFRGQAHHYLTRLMREHGENFMMWDRYVILNDVDAIRDVLETHNLDKTSEVKRGYRSMFYRRGGILAAPWKQWIQQRRMTAPALSKAVIGELAPKFELGARSILQMLENAAAKGEVVEMDQAFTCLTLDTIGLVLLGRTFGVGDRLLAGDKSKVPFSDSLNIMTNEAIRQMTLPSSLLRLFPPGEKVKDAKDLVDSFLEECVAERIRERETGGANQTDMMNILLDAESTGAIKRDDVKGQLLTFLFAGHDTTAHTLSWLLYEVSLNSNLQQALYEEAKDTLPCRDDFPMDSNVLETHLPLLDCVWQETNRKHPAAATGTLRKVGKDPIVVGNGLELPAKACVLIPPFSLHRNEKYWPNPEEFDPSRFSEDVAACRDPMAFQAFSAGPRNCIGARLARAEAMSVMACIFRRFKIKCEEKGEPADFCSLTRRPRHGIRFQFSTRP